VKSARSSRRAIRIVSQCATAEEFLSAFHPYLERDSLFIATGSPEEPGQAVRFVLTLAGGETVLRGAGRVLETHRDRGNFYGLRGMKLQFDELDDGSRRALAALESRAGGHKARGVGGAGAAADVIECLIYDDPGTESADPAAVGGARRAVGRATAERIPSLSDDDVTAVTQAPTRAPRASSGTGPQPRHATPPRVQVAGAVPVAMSAVPAQHAQLGGPSFIVPRPRTDQDTPEGEAVPMSPLRPTPVDLADMPTDMMPALRPRPGAPLQPVPPGPAGLPPSGVRLAHTPAHGLPSGPPLPPHMMPPDPAGFPGDFSMPPTRAGSRRGVPRPPMPTERTELVRFSRPSYVRTAAVSATLGALLGLAAGYLLWGMDHTATRASSAPAPAEETAPADRPQPPAAKDDTESAALPTTADAGPAGDPTGTVPSRGRAQP
jgi:hypothetical protein